MEVLFVRTDSGPRQTAPLSLTDQGEESGTVSGDHSVRAVRRLQTSVGDVAHQRRRGHHMATVNAKKNFGLNFR